MTDLVSLLSAPSAIVGTTGAGKTFAAKGVVEVMLAEGRRVIIIDPTGAWYGLRSGADGSANGGFPILIFGGDHADIEISPDSGEQIAEALARRNVQAIVDTSEMTGGQKVRFLTAFFEKLYALNKAALHLIVDEADEICPQNPMPNERRLSGAFDRIVRRGRIKGFRPVMITQRPAVLHKNVLSQIGTLIALKLTSPQDRKAIDDWVKGNADTDQARQVMNSLPTLSRGEGWVWSPASDVLERIKFSPIKTFDSSRTPEAGETQLAPALTDVDVDALRDAMSQSVASVETEKRDKTVRHAKPPSSQETTALVSKADQAGFERGLAEGIERGKTQGISIGLARARSALDAIRIPDIVDEEHKATETNVAPKMVTPPPATRRPKKPRDLSTDPILMAAYSVYPTCLSWQVLASMCGRKARGGHFNTIRKALIEGGYVTDDKGVVTPLTVAEGDGNQIPADLLERNLPQPSAKMFSMIRSNPEISIPDLAQALQMKPHGGHWNTGMSVLRKNNLITDLNGILSIRPELTAPLEE